MGCKRSLVQVQSSRPFVLMNRTEDLIENILARNKRVEAEKAWEVSRTRRAVIAIFTYVCACILLWSLGSTQFLLQALVPAVGYLLSTLSLPWVKRRWMRTNRHQNGDV